MQVELHRGEGLAGVGALHRRVHRQPVVGGVDLRRLLRVRGRRGGDVHGVADRRRRLLGVDEAVAAHPQAVVGLGQVRHHEAAVVVGDDDLAIGRGRSSVSAMTHTPASGPACPEVTVPSWPPRGWRAGGVGALAVIIVPAAGHQQTGHHKGRDQRDGASPFPHIRLPPSLLGPFVGYVTNCATRAVARIDRPRQTIVFIPVNCGQTRSRTP